MAETRIEKKLPTVELGGRIWFLKITHQVLERFSALTRCNLEDFDAAIARYDYMALLLWLMMAESQPDLGRDEVREWLQALPVRDAVQLVTNAVGEAGRYAFPAPSGDAPRAEDADAPENPTDADI